MPRGPGTNGPPPASAPVSSRAWPGSGTTHPGTMSVDRITVSCAPTTSASQLIISPLAPRAPALRFETAPRARTEPSTAGDLYWYCMIRGTSDQIAVSDPDGEGSHDRTRVRIARGSVEYDGAGVLDADTQEEDTTGWLCDAAIAVPMQKGRLPDGRPSLVIGDVRGYAAFNHLQGDNPEHDCGDCGIVSCADVLNQFGVRLTEADAYVHATRCHELHVVPERKEQSGWTLPAEQAAILTDYGVPAHAEEAQQVERLALAVQHGHGVIAMVNAGVLWSNPRVLGHGQANHAVTITGIARDPYDGALLGLYINDSGNGQSGQFVSEHLMTSAFEHEGGFCVVTDSAHAAGLAGT